MGRRWTPQEIDQLKKMAQRYPAPKIAELFDRTVGGVMFKASQLKIIIRSRRQNQDEDGRRAWARATCNARAS